MKSVFALVALAAAAVQPALGHYRFYKYIDSAGTVTGEYVYVRANTNINSPANITSTDLRCNAGGLTSGSSTSTATVAAGATVGFQADIPLSHPGPTQVYLGKVPSGQTAATWDGSGANWFKIYALGADFSTGSLAWPSSNKQTFTFKIPSGVPAGNYLLRIEHIALHSASSAGGAQFYASPIT
ncbi:hypothetical protein FS749_008807 [Ceratobasidium sp. UAMH 11750]|nr:hypothetical protein FS749_008807 [Ceratobasidium sp. UAMH 11750]